MEIFQAQTAEKMAIPWLVESKGLIMIKVVAAMKRIRMEDY